MCAPADISFYSIFQVAPNKMSKHNTSTCWNIHSGPKANIEIELGPICSLWLKGFEKRNNIHLSETNCHRTINHWEVSSSSLPHYKHLINLPFSIYQRERYGPQSTWRLLWRNDLLENERLLNCKSPPIWGQLSLNSYTKCLVYNWVPKGPTSWTGFGKHHHRHHNSRPYCSQGALEERGRRIRD